MGLSLPASRDDMMAAHPSVCRDRNCLAFVSGVSGSCSKRQWHNAARLWNAHSGLYARHQASQGGWWACGCCSQAAKPPRAPKSRSAESHPLPTAALLPSGPQQPRQQQPSSLPAAAAASQPPRPSAALVGGGGGSGGAARGPRAALPRGPRLGPAPPGAGLPADRGRGGDPTRPRLRGALRWVGGWAWRCCIQTTSGRLPGSPVRCSWPACTPARGQAARTRSPRCRRMCRRREFLVRAAAACQTRALPPTGSQPTAAALALPCPARPAL